MAEKLSINVLIAGSTYSLNVKKEEEEEVRKAAKMISDNVKNMLEKFAIKDKQTPLALTALQYTTQLVQKSKGVNVEKSDIESLNRIENKLSDYIKSAKK